MLPSNLEEVKDEGPSGLLATDFGAWIATWAFHILSHSNLRDQIKPPRFSGN